MDQQSTTCALQITLRWWLNLKLTSRRWSNLIHTTSKQFGLTINMGKQESRLSTKNLNLSPSASREIPWTTFNPSHIFGVSSMKMPLVLMTLPTKMELYRVLILSTATCGSESWALKTKDEQRLLTFEMSCLRRITGVSLKNVTIRAQTNCEISIVQKIQHKQVLYFGNVSRRSNTRLPKIVLECSIEGLRPRGRPPKRWLDNVRSSCHDLGLESVCEAKMMTEHRRIWISLVKWLLSAKTSRDSEGGQH